MSAAVHLRAGRRARGGRPAVRGRHGRGGPAADLGAARRVRASSIRTARSRAGSAAAAPSPSSSARRSASLGDGQPRLLRLSKDAPAEGRRGDGVIELVMTCHSGGTLEIYVEPHLPAPVLWVAGTTPIAGALAAPRLGRRLAGDRHRSDRRGRRVPGRRTGRAPADIRGLDPDAAPYVVVATPGHLGRGGRRPRRSTRDASYVGPRRLADAGRGRPRLAARGDDGRATSGSPRCARRPASISAPRRPRRSPSRSWPSSSRSVAAGRTSSPRPGPATVAGVAAAPGRRSNRSSTTSSCSIRSAG